MRKRIYTDTSVLGGCEDSEFRDDSRRLMREFVAGRSILVISDLTLGELENSPPAVRDIPNQVPIEHVETIFVTKDEIDLAEAYITQGAISSKMRTDALHIALATIARVDVLVSWNFQHIVNLNRIHAYNSVNLKLGYPLIEIRTPKEVIYHET